MKTSKILLTSLLAAAAMSTVPAWATDYTVTGAFTGIYNNDNITGTIDGTAKTVSVTSTDTLTFSGATSGYFPRWSGGTFTGNIVIANGGSITITNGGSSTYMIFSGSLSGAGTFSTNNNNDPAKGQDFIFTGDLTSFTGTFTRPNANFNASTTDIYNNKDTGILQFGGTVSSDNGIGAGTAYVASATADEDGIVHNISGTGTIATSSVLRYNYTGSENDGVSSLGIDNSAISARYIDFRGGANYTVSSTVTGNNSTASNNTLTLSAGTTTFTGTVSNFGNISVASGATLAVGTDGKLDLSGSKVTLASTITNTGTVTVDSNMVFVLADTMGSDSVYTVISGSGTVSDGSTLTHMNFQHTDGTTFTGRSTVNVETSGTVTVTEVAVADLVWNGGASGGTWGVQTTKNWLNGGTADMFYTDDNVTFSTPDANVTVSGTVAPGAMTVSQATTLSGTGTVSVTSGLTLDADLTLDSGVALSAGTLGSAEALYDATHVKGSGTFGFSAVASGNGSGINLSNFSGEVYLKGGLLEFASKTDTVDFTSSLGSGALRVASGAHLVFNGTGTNVSNDITFEGNSTIHANGGKTGTLSGKVSSTGTLTKDGGGTLTIAGTANIGTLTLSKGSMVVSDDGVLTTTGGSMAANTSLTLNGTNKSTLVFTGDIGAATLNITNGDVTWTHKDANKSSGATITIGEGSSFKDNSNYKHTLALSGKLSGAGTLISGVATTANQGDGFRDVTLSGSTAGFTGTWELETASSSDTSGNRRINGILNSSDGVFGGVISFTDSSASESKTSSTLSLAKDMTIGGLKGTLSNTIVKSSSDTTARALTINTVDGASYEYAGTIASTISSLTKTGTGTQTLSGDNSAFSGNVNINVGTLVAGSTSALGSGKTTVAADAALGLIAGTTVEVAGGVELADGAKIVVDMSAFTDKAETFALNLITTSALKYGETSITSDNVGTLLTGGVVSLSNWDKTGWTQSLSYAGNTLSLTMTIPEPSTFGLLAGVGALALVAARRRRRAK